MNVVGRVGNFITQGMYSVATPFHPFGGAVDIIVVKQQDGTFRSTPWYVRFGKFQGVLKGAEKVVRIEVNGIEANFNMYLDNSGEAYFLKEVDHGKDDNEGLKDSDELESRKEEDSRDEGNSDNHVKENDLCGLDDNNYNYGEVDGRVERFNLGINRLERVESDCNTFYEFQDEQASLEGSLEFTEYGSSRYDTLHSVENALESQNSTSEVILVSVDGHVITAPISSSERNSESVQLSTPQFHLGPGGGTEEYNRGGATWTSDYLSSLEAAEQKIHQESVGQSNSRFLSPENQLEHCEGSGHAHEIPDSSKSAYIDSSSGSPLACLKKDGVFKSCLELPALALQPAKGSHGKMEADDSSPNDSEYSNTVSLPESLVGAAKQGIDTSDRDDNDSVSTPSQSVSNNSEPKEQFNVDAVVKSEPSNANVPASNDESNTSEHAKSHPEASMRGMELSLCGNLLHTGLGLLAAEDVFEANIISSEEFKLSAASIVNNENLIIRIQGKYLPWARAMHIILGRAAFGLNLPVEPHDRVPVELDVPEVKEDGSAMTSTPRRRWRLWPIPFRRVQTLEHTTSNSSNEESFLDSESVCQSQSIASVPTSIGASESPHKQIVRTKVPTTDQVASLNLREGQNMVNFIFSTRVLGSQKVEAHIYLWKWNTRIVISDVDGTITKSDVLGQFMPLVGRDWTHSGIARLYSGIKIEKLPGPCLIGFMNPSIITLFSGQKRGWDAKYQPQKENGYQLLFLSARAIVQAYLTKSFLFNLKQDGKSLPNGPVVISPDGLFPSLYREVIRRAPHEFKIACLEDIKALFPSDYNPFYAGFGNRDTDELSYRKIGIPKGKIFIINPKGEVAINHRIDVKSYTSLHTLVNDMFPPTSLVEQEDFNSWNYWKMPLPDLDNL